MTTKKIESSSNPRSWEKDVRVMIDDEDHIEYCHTVCGKECDIRIDWTNPIFKNGARTTWFYVKCPRCAGCRRWTRFRKTYITAVRGKFPGQDLRVRHKNVTSNILGSSK